MDLILDWNDLIEGYIYWPKQRDIFRAFLAERFVSYNPLESMMDFPWEEVSSASTLEFAEKIRRKDYLNRAILTYGFPVRRYRGPFVAEGNHYVVGVGERKHREGIDVDLMIEEKRSGMIEGALIVEDLESEFLVRACEPKVFSLMRNASPEALDIIAHHLFTSSVVDSYADC